MVNYKRNFTATYMQAYSSNLPYPVYCHKDEVDLWKRRFREEKQRHSRTNGLVRRLRLVFTWDEKQSILFVKFREWNLTTKQTRGIKK
jgi:hypothetical protein